MQTLPACREHTLQVDEGCAAARALIETMLKTTTPHAVENGQKIEALSSRWEPTLHPMFLPVPGSNRKENESSRGIPHTASMTKPRNSTILPDRLRDLTAELSRHAPASANRLARAKTEREFLKVVCELFNLATVLTPEHYSLLRPEGLSKEITEFMSSNLHKGLTLKLLAQFLGYSEKYCSDLFQSTMGESFSGYLKRRRTDTASSLLATTDKSVAEIAAVLGFSDQFSFSHFFKRSTGLSPREFRTDRGPRRPLQINASSYRGNR